MAPLTILRAQVRIPMDSGVPADDVTNTFHFLDNSVGTQAAACDKIIEQLARFYTHFDGALYSKKISGATEIRIYDLADATPRVPVRDDIASLTLAPLAGNALPPELAVCCSFKSTPVSGVHPGSLRGRVYLGPLDEAAIDTNGLVAAAVLTSIADAADELRTEAAADNIPWVIYSPTRDAGGETLVGSAAGVHFGYVDNAPDVQRRRGVDATTRTLWPQVTVRSKTLYQGQPAVGAQTLYTCPASVRTVVKGWQATNGAGAASVLALSMTRGGVGVLLHPLSLALASFAQLASDHWFVLETGDTIDIVTTVLGAQVLISGAELAL